MKFYFTKCESTRCALRRINCELRARIRKTIDDESLDADTAVHELRKCIKKLRAVLRFSKPALEKKVFRRADRALRDFARKVSGTRDSAVLVKTFDGLMEHYRPFLSTDELLPVRQSLQNRHVLAMARYQERLDLGKLETARIKLERQLERVDKTKIPRRRLKAGLREVYRLGRDRQQALARDPSTDNSHDLRRQAKYLWYQLRLLKNRLPDNGCSLTKDLKALGRLLGDDNNMAVLVDTLQASPEICGNRVRAELICSLAESRRIALLSAALHLSASLYARKPGRFVRELFPPA